MSKNAASGRRRAIIKNDWKIGILLLIGNSVPFVIHFDQLQLWLLLLWLWVQLMLWPQLLRFLLQNEANINLSPILSLVSVVAAMGMQCLQDVPPTISFLSLAGNKWPVLFAGSCCLAWRPGSTLLGLKLSRHPHFNGSMLLNLKSPWLAVPDPGRATTAPGTPRGAEVFSGRKTGWGGYYSLVLSDWWATAIPLASHPFTRHLKEPSSVTAHRADSCCDGPSQATRGESETTKSLNWSAVVY